MVCGTSEMTGPGTAIVSLLRLIAGAAVSLAMASTMASAAPDEAIAKIKPSVVAVGTFLQTRNPAFQITGTGFAVGDGTMIATNAHVIPRVMDTEHRETVVIALPNATGGQATLLATKTVVIDREYDLAILSIEGKVLPAVRLAASGNVKEGQSLFFTGFPIGTVLGLFPATHHAMVSALTPIAIPRSSAGELDAAAIKRLANSPYAVIQLDGTAYPGNSGSPLYDETGAVVGVINMVFVKGARENAISQPSGIAYAIPVQPLAELIVGKRR
jgi:serine protease Do